VKAEGICLTLLVVVACDKGSAPPPTPAPVPRPPPADAVDPCAAPLAEVGKANAAVKKALADQHLEDATVDMPPMPFELGVSGVEPPPDEVAREQREWEPFTDKHTGDRVRWTTGGGSHEGIMYDTVSDWHIVRRGSDLFLATARSVRTVVCEDKARIPTNCGFGGHTIRAFAVPRGMKFGGIIKLDVERVEMVITGAECPPPPP